MKKIILGFLMLSLLFCSGCSKQSLADRAEEGNIYYADYTHLVKADSETHILYIETHYTLSPYYSKNGKLCKYEDGKIIEIE